MEFPLTAEQQAGFDLIVGTRDNYFITGKPGTGKSVLTRAVIAEWERKNYENFEVGAPTGLAALNVNGRTLHSIFRLPTSQGVIHPDYTNYTTDDKVIRMIKFHIKTLIIDEISMVRADMFDYIDRFMRHCKQIDLPFGGAQVIAVGDYFQLPPVTVEYENVEIRQFYKSPFAFDSHVWKNNFRTIQLTQVLRQKGDDAFIRLLDVARSGEVNAAQVAWLNKNVSKQDDERIRLCSTNKQADEVNRMFLNKIDSPEVVFTAREYGKWPSYPVAQLICLKVGAKVMVKKNRADLKPGAEKSLPSKVVNGTMAKVLEINENTSAVKILLDETGAEVTIFMAQWEHKIKNRDTDNKWQEKVVASYGQIPLELAWAISFHKSQGQSFARAHIDPNKIFAAGQMYVGLSRGRELAGISFESPVEAKMFRVDEDVKNFYKNL